MKPPKLIYVGPFDYEVKEVKRKDLLGETFNNDCVIELKSDQASPNKRDTLLHEILHAIFFQSGAYKSLSHDDEERVIVTISPWILQLLRENPKLLTFLLRDSDKAEAA